MYNRISDIVQRDRKAFSSNTALNSFSFLDQKGPRSLNTINKRNQSKDIENENLKIKAKIEKAKSIYSINALDMH